VSTHESIGATSRAAETLDDAHKLRPRIVVDHSNELFLKPATDAGRGRAPVAALACAAPMSIICGRSVRGCPRSRDANVATS
jgi:hypothetical protein